jgi:hypothetical protein
MSPELRERLTSLTKNQRHLLVSTLERLPDQGADLIEADIHILLDELIAPTPMEVIRLMSPTERSRCKRLYSRLGRDTLSTDELAQAVPWLADFDELTRRVEAQRAQEPPAVYDPDD